MDNPMIPAIFWYKETNGLVSVQYGTSNFKRFDDMFVKFDNGKSTQPLFAGSVLKDTPKNREIVQQIVENFRKLHELDDWTSKEMYRLLNTKDV